MLEEYIALQAKLNLLEKKINTAKMNFEENTARYESAKQAFAKERADVEKLEAESLSSFLKRLVGNYDKKYDKEMAEQLAAKRELDLSAALLMEAREDLDTLQNSVPEIDHRLSYMKEQLLNADPSFREKIDTEELKRADLNQEVQELEEALTAGEQVLEGIDFALDDLDSADSYSTWDMFTDSSLIFDMMKYDKIDKAEAKMTQLEQLLQHYTKELKDVSLDSFLTYEKFSGMSKTFDIFFDNLFSDWDTKAKIGRNIEMLESLGHNIEELQDKLETQKTAVQKEIVESKKYF